MAKKVVMSYDEMLESALDVEKPYEVPANWVWTSLGEVFEWGSGGTPSRKFPEFFDGTIPWVKSGDLCNGYIYSTEENITDEAIKKSSAKLMPINTIIIAMYGATIGKVGILGVEATTNQACACAKPNENVELKYLFYYLINEKENFIKKGKGGAQPNISQDVIKKHEFPISPYAEQKRIVETIENLFARLDKAKELIEESLETFENRKSAILHKAFTGELTQNWRVENGIGFESWEEKEFEKFCFLNRGFDLPAKDRIEGCYSLVTSSGENDTHNEFRVKGPGVVTGRSGSIGKVFYIEGDFWPLNTTLFSKKTYNNDIRFIFYFLQYFNLKKYSSSTAVPTLNRNNFSKEVVKIPKVIEQKEIVLILDKILEKEDKTKELINLLDHIEVMKKTILAKAFRGELGTNIAEEESGLELLKKIISDRCSSEDIIQKIKISSEEDLLNLIKKKKKITMQDLENEIEIKEIKLKFYIGELLEKDLITLEKGIIRIAK